MYTPTQIELIKEFGRKDLMEGVIIRYDDEYFNLMCEIEGGIAIDSIQNYRNIALYFGEDDFEILGHIPHLEDVFRLAKEKGMGWVANSDNWIAFNNGKENIGNGIEYYHTISLLDQPEETLTQLLTLFKSC